MNPVREQVWAQLVQVCRDAKAAGKDGMAEIERCFPGTPIEVATVAWCRAEDEAVEAWWQSVEKTIDLHVVKEALLTAPVTELGVASNSSDFFETSAVWAIYHLREALTQFNANETAEFHCAMRKFGACAKAMLDTLPEVKL